MNSQGQLHCQPGFSLIQIEATDLSDAVHPVDQGVAMNEQRLGRLREIPIIVKIGFQGAQKLSTAIMHQ